jgi:hypothetical protein
MALIGLDKALGAIDAIRQEQNDNIRAVWIQGLKAIITATPVHFKDGGRLKNNWFLTKNKPSQSKRGKNRGGSGSFSSVDKMPRDVLGKEFYFTNNMPYANVVEYGGYPQNPVKGTWTGSNYQKLSQNGYSRQAPSGMVRINLVKMRNRL